MRAFITGITLFLLLVLPGEVRSEAPAAAAGVHPVADLLALVAGDDFRVVSLFGPGVHPRQAGAEAAAVPRQLHVYVRVGDSLEGSADRAAAGAAQEVLDLSRALPFIGEETEERTERRIFAAALGADAVKTPRANPWFWLDPRMAADAVDLMTASLSAARPEARDRLEKRAAALKERLARLDSKIEGMLAGQGDPDFPVFTVSWAYFARRYGLREVHLAGVAPGGGPGRTSLKGSVARLRKSGSPRAFFDLTFPPGPARTVAEKAGAVLVTLYPLGRGEAEHGYFDILTSAARAIAGEGP